MTRHFLTMTDVSEQELKRLIALARRMKHDRTLGAKTLTGKTVALVFQKPSMRTRVAFEVAVLQLGGAAVYLGQDDIHLGKREPVRDVARVLSRYVDAIVVRVFAHADAAEFAHFSRVPVLNGLSDLVHPCQAVADLMTLEEFFGDIKGLRIAYIGDGNNVLHSFAEGAAALGASVTVASPKGYTPDGALWKAAARTAQAHGAALRLEQDPTRAVKGADVIYTDVWVSMGQEQERAKRLKIFRPYQVDKKLVSLAKPGCRILHCLPAHRGEEISDEVMESSGSLIFEQAENRLHAHKALLQFVLGQGEGR